MHARACELFSQTAAILPSTPVACVKILRRLISRTYLREYGVVFVGRAWNMSCHARYHSPGCHCLSALHDNFYRMFFLFAFTRPGTRMLPLSVPAGSTPALMCWPHARVKYCKTTKNSVCFQIAADGSTIASKNTRVTRFNNCIKQ